jgi:hypothetical protein
MAIIGPEQLPAICHYASDPVKFEILSTLGHPTVLVELTEPQLEQAIRVTGDFIAQYFPFVEKYAYFQAQPLVSTYDIPADAYWIKDVKWSPSTVRIGDIFGAESFLFCYPGGSNILTTHGPMVCESLYEKPNTRIVTAFRPHKPRMRWNDKKQPITILQTENDYLACTPNHPISCNGKFIPAEKCNLGDKLITSNDKLKEIIGKKESITDGTWSIQNKTGSMFVSALGKEFYLSH